MKERARCVVSCITHPFLPTVGGKDSSWPNKLDHYMYIVSDQSINTVIVYRKGIGKINM